MGKLFSAGSQLFKAWIKTENEVRKSLAIDGPANPPRVTRTKIIKSAVIVKAPRSGKAKLMQDS